MIPHVLARAGTDPRLPAQVVRVLVVAHAELDYILPRPLKVRWLAKVAHVHASQASRALRLLIDHGYIVAGPRLDDGRRTYRLTQPAVSLTQQHPC